MAQSGAKSHRRTIVLIALALVVLFLRQHIFTAYHILSVYALWHASARHVALSTWRDGFDTTFAAYPINQTTASFPAVPGEDVVPPILHHILLGRPISSSPANWNASRDACLALHPVEQGWQHLWWDDESAERFLQETYPWALRFFLDYSYGIQRADALRYFILHHYGGIFLDLDLECQRSLGPLRRFPTVTIAASPAGVSNGFLVAEPRHPFFAQLIENLRLYDLNWFGSSYVSIMFSTGPMFLSAEHLRYSPRLHRRDDLRVLTSRMHALNGVVTTPLFRHLGSSSWHGNDAHMIRQILGWLKTPGHMGYVLVGVALGAFIGIYLAPNLARRWPRIRRHLGIMGAPSVFGHKPSASLYRDDIEASIPLTSAMAGSPSSALTTSGATSSARAITANGTRSRSGSLEGSIIGGPRAQGGPGLYVLVELAEENGEDVTLRSAEDAASISRIASPVPPAHSPLARPVQLSESRKSSYRRELS